MSLYRTACNLSTATCTDARRSKHARVYNSIGGARSAPSLQCIWLRQTGPRGLFRNPSTYMHTYVRTYIRLFKPTFPPETDKLISYANTCGESLSTAATHGSANSLFRTSALIFERFRISWLAYASRIPLPGSQTSYRKFRPWNEKI